MYVSFKYSCVYHSMKQNVTLSQEAAVGSTLVIVASSATEVTVILNSVLMVTLLFFSNFFIRIFTVILKSYLDSSVAVNWIILYWIILYSDQFLLFNIIFLRFIQVSAYVYNSLSLDIIFHYMKILQVFYPFYCWQTFGLFLGFCSTDIIDIK